MLKVAILCNSRLGSPAIQHLAASGQLMACACPEKMHEETEEIAYVCTHLNIPFRTFTNQQLKVEMDEWISSCKADAVLVFTFPYRIPENLLRKPKFGFINFHFGLLPQYRGSDAIFWQLKNREKKGGITAHVMTAAFDKGPIYVRKEVPINPEDTYGMHSNFLAMAAPQMVTEVLHRLQQGTPPTAQQETEACYYPKPQLKDVMIDWTKSAEEIMALIRACNPWNRGALTTLNQFPVRVINSSTILPCTKKYVPGEIITADNENGLQVACGKNQQLRLDTCLLNNEFISTPRMGHTGLQPGLIFDPIN